jgi:catechol 2,3-dioxygenase-like lactoylglutathione lyase family enzyme
VTDAAIRLHHVQTAIPAGGEEAARRFYGDLLGPHEIPKPANLRARGGVWFATASLPLHLGVDPAFRPATKAHVAFQVPDLPALRRRLLAAGHHITIDEPLPGYDRCHTTDPFGNRVEVLQSIAETLPIAHPGRRTTTVVHGVRGSCLLSFTPVHLGR